MDESEAKGILSKKIAELRAFSYADLQGMQTPQTEQVTGPSGRIYELETQSLWDDRAKKNLRVMVSIDDAGLRSLAPLSADFIITPHGRFVGE